jgi:membrane protein DedA with SNARE-associated domain
MALVAGTFFEGETILVAAGFAAHLGDMKLPWVILAAFAGGLAGDQFYFCLGRMKGKEFLQKRPRWQEKTAKVLNILERYQTPLILGFRFMYGIRTVTPFTIGLSGVNRGRFLVLNMIGVLVWAVAVSCVGYLFGATAVATALVDTKKYRRWIMLGIICTGALAWIAYFLNRRGANRGKRGT